MSDNRSDLAIKRDEWLDSDEGQGCLSAETLMRSNDPGKYLRNRIELAFLAGARMGVGAKYEKFAQRMEFALTALER